MSCQEGFLIQIVVLPVDLVLPGRLSYPGGCLARGSCLARKAVLSWWLPCKRVLSCQEGCLIQVVALPEGLVLQGRLSYPGSYLAIRYGLARKVVLSRLLSC